MTHVDEASHVAALWILRVGVAMEFVGHGMLGFSHPPAWANYFSVVGIQPELAFRLMPLIGALDILMGLCALLVPCRALLLYMAVWGLWTALLRPLSGESIWETVERAGNCGAPFALFLLLKGACAKDWFVANTLSLPSEERDRRLSSVLRWTTVLLVVGHGALGALVQKPLFAFQYSQMGFPGALMEPWVGGFEIVLGLALGFVKSPGLLLVVVVWKLATELLSPMTGSSIWVFVEHGGSFAAPLALLVLQKFELRKSGILQNA